MCNSVSKLQKIGNTTVLLIYVKSIKISLFQPKRAKSQAWLLTLSVPTTKNGQHTQTIRWLALKGF